MTSDIEKAILKTLIYSDVFEYPLTKEELWKYLINSKNIRRGDFEQALKSSKNIKKQNGRYCLLDRTLILRSIRVKNKESKRKVEMAKRVSRVLSKIPTIQLIGISGALAMNNADKDDDIDLFVICSKKTLWITRIFILLVLELLRVRRKRNQTKVSDTICVNMILTEEALNLPGVKKDLYLAHEIVQLKPIFDRGNVYKRFINSNMWVARYLPSALKRGTMRNHTRNNAEGFFSVFLRFVLRFSALEELARTVQLFSINRHKTTEFISDSLLAFHPFDWRKKVLSEYKKRLKQYEV